MADGVEDLLLWGDDFKVVLDILEGEEAVEQPFVATAKNVSSNCTNLQFEFLATNPKQSLVYVYLWDDKLLESNESKNQKFNLNIHALPATTCQCFCTS